MTFGSQLMPIKGDTTRLKCNQLGMFLPDEGDRSSKLPREPASGLRARLRKRSTKVACRRMLGSSIPTLRDNNCTDRHWFCVKRSRPTLLVAEGPSSGGTSFEFVSTRAFPIATVISAASIQESLYALEAHKVDIAVVDLHLPDGSGIDLVQACARSHPSAVCVVTTTYDDDCNPLPALAAGASGYLLRNQPEEVLVQQLRLTAEGVLPLAPSIARRLLEHFAEQFKDACAAAPSIGSVKDGLIPLSEREKQVLRLIAKGLQIGEAAPLLKISTNTVCSHVKNIYRKRHISSRAEAAIEAQRLGLI